MESIPGHEEQFANAIIFILHDQVPLFGIEQHTLGLASQSLKSLEDHERIAQVHFVGGILGVGKP